LKYALDQKKGMQIVCTNCPSNPLPTMLRTAGMRPEILKPVGHISLSLPPSTGRFSADRWVALADELRLQIGLDDTFPLLVVQHQDTEHDHVHILFSRVSIEGRVHDQSNIGLRLMAAERVLEDRFSLPLVPRGQKANINKDEIERAVRTSKPPARVEIARALDEALRGSPTLNQLIERLDMAGISTRTNKSASTGKVSGLSFELDGVALRASQIGKQYGWKALSERLSGEVKNEQARSNQQAAKPDQGARGGSKDPAGTNSATHQAQPATARLAGKDQQSAASADLAIGRADVGGRPAGGDGRLWRLSANQDRSTSNKAVQTNQKGDSKMTATTQDYMTGELAGRDPMLMTSTEIMNICLSSSTSPRVQNYFSGVADGKIDGVGDKDDDDYLAGLNFARAARRAAGLELPFAETRRLDQGVREWVESIPNRIRPNAGLFPRGERLALMDSRGRVAAVFHRGEILIPDPRILQPEQIAALMAELEAGGQQIEVEGNPALLDKIQVEAVSRGLLQERIVQEQIAQEQDMDTPALKM